MIEIESAQEGRPGLAALEPADRELVMRLFGRLSPESVYRRFFSPIARPEQFAADLLRVDHHEREAVAALEDGEIVAVAQYSRKPGDVHADLAVVVADEWQQQGLGTRLVAALADRALRRGVTTFAVDVQGDNYGVLKLLRRVAPGIRLAFSGGVGEGSFQLRNERQ